MRYSDKIGKDIRCVREAKGYSQEYMAEMLDMVQSSYANLESGKSSMSIDRLLRICDILHLDVHALLDRSGTFSSPPDQHPEYMDKIKVAVQPEVIQVYGELIAEMKSEIEFLRGLVNRKKE
ncbi:MAG: helix-turn-helix transcriptional regulator [Saprospiraceae bacterium]|nr:helix-turn-helix transcriptional regulator [Saprospiraceae bacterium]